MSPVAFAPPVFLSQLSANGSIHALLLWALIILFVVWAIHTLVVIYHWMKYSHHPALALPAIGTHLAVSFFCLAYAFSALLSI